MTRARHSAVAVISQVPPPVHGSTVMTKVLLETLSRLGLHTTLVDRRFSNSITDVGRFRFRKLFSAGSLILRLWWTLVAIRPSSTVFFCTTRRGSFIVDWLLSELLRTSQTRCVNYLHTQGYTALARRNRLWSFMVSRLLTSAEVTVCLGPSLYGDVATWVPANRVEYIANTLLDPPGYAGSNVDRRTTILFLSNLIPGKGAELFVDVARRAAKRNIEARFLVAGAGELDRTLTVPPNLEFVGAVHGDEKWNMLEAASALVFPSTLNEAQPLTIVESMAVGTPVIAFRLGGIPDLIRSGTEGYLLEPRDVGGIVDRIERLLCSEKDQEDMSRNARNAFDERFSPAAYETSWRALLNELGV